MCFLSGMIAVNSIGSTWRLPTPHLSWRIAYALLSPNRGEVKDSGSLAGHILSSFAFLAQVPSFLGLFIWSFGLGSPPHVSVEITLSGGGRERRKDTLPHPDPGHSTFPSLALLPHPLSTPELRRLPGGSLNSKKSHLSSSS